MIQGMGNVLVEVCWCFNIDPYLGILILTKKKVEPICIEKIVDTGSSIKQFSQLMGVTVFLVKMWPFMLKTWLLEHPVWIMKMVLMNWQCINLRWFLVKHRRRIKK